MKRGIVVFLFAVAVIFLAGSVSSLGISPAFKEYNFDPGLKGSISYTVSAPDDKELEISLEGDLVEYVKLSKTTLKGSGSFSAEFELPQSVEKPGMHRIRVYVGEKVDPELAAGFIGTRLVVISQIDIYVPYPGRYLETSLKAHDVNLGEPVNFELDIVSQGEEDVTIKPRIEVFSQGGEQIDTLNFNERVIKSQEKIGLQKSLDTSGLNAGNYKAISIIDYGNIAQSEAEFRIGELVVNIVGHTSELYTNKLQKFDIAVESGWNEVIDGAYANVAILNATGNVAIFKTSTTSLFPWEEANITGYVDTNGLQPGLYNANISLIYFGKEQGRSTSKLVQISLIKPPSLLMWYLIGGIGILIILMLLGIKLFRKKGKKKW